ncbi:hypothetical protein [Geitlerinema sp. PCC 9228]|jgi:hypothetical protein|uniref:hypothetical protein n=1 Tax=Geitlerinema sp. PCC 9228 TaxID=111611 RepID=UPI0008F9C27A|nr:hypothetical protein [Geitlerinema sp. PCC 9228]
MNKSKQNLPFKGFGRNNRKRLTVTAYGESEDRVHHVAAVLHFADSGDIIKTQLYDSGESIEVATEEIVKFAEKEDAEIYMVNQVLPAESCPHCGGKEYRVVRDADLERMQ